MHPVRCAIFVLFAALTFGCASQPHTPQTTVDISPSPASEQTPDTSESSASADAAVPTSPRLQIADIQPFAQHIEWPTAPEAKAIDSFNIASGAEDHVWVEGKGYFDKTLDAIYADLINPLVIGPIHMTKDIVRDQFVETENQTSYVMHVKMKYVMTIEFDLSVTIQKIYDNDQYIGLLYTSEKTAGTRFISKISDTIFVKKMNETQVSVELSSINVATMDKEKEAREHIEVLFQYWNGKPLETAN